MKKTLLFISIAFLAVTINAQTELVLNGTCDDFQEETGDNADAWDMTPNSKVKLDGENGAESDSPYAAIWKNDALEDALEIKYLGAAGSLDEQPGSTSSGNNGTRGVKLYDDGNPSITGSSRRLYQLVKGLVIGNTYNFSIDSNSEAAGTPSEVYILNNEISNEDGIDANGYTDASVTAGMSITNDEGQWVTTTFSFVATTTEVVIYVRALAADSGDTEVFYDNISLKQAAAASVDDIFASQVSVYPNPANEFVKISSSVDINKVEIYNLLGKKVISTSKLTNNNLDVSSLSKGVYLMKLTSGESVASRKLIKN
ncbi:T9SS type A sorting domain-containing protein [Polaribacter sp. Hel_I_88]|uniref:T9SS type A sorting domain-containing protein n=1 Tax=Polaribacter sp. Hel_I_88 TaxID=1250006 RepID=UPI0009DF205E|nr:T9SS type A sorting domain-containing protein [Polaribacter sp. Hel_I_88]